MYFFGLLSSAAALVFARPSGDNSTVCCFDFLFEWKTNIFQQSSSVGIDLPKNCNNHVGDCYAKGKSILSVPQRHAKTRIGCDPAILNITSIYGTCSSGKYSGCPCNRCAGVSNCQDDGCNGAPKCLNEENRNCLQWESFCTNGLHINCPCQM